jgi:hypothetical protein
MLELLTRAIRPDKEIFKKFKKFKKLKKLKGYNL